MRRMLRPLSFAVLIAGTALAIGGCSKTPSIQDVCEKVASDDVADCVEELTHDLGECPTARDDVLKCVMDAEGRSAQQDCFQPCEDEAEGAGE